MESPNPNLSLLLDEAAWLKRLALHLTRDPASADDVVQATWAAALENQDRQSIRSPRAWLGQLARRIAGKDRLGSARRIAREDASARSERDGASPEDEVAERMELQRILGEELVRLPEPFRGVLFQQYYEGKSPQEIAMETGTPAGTVRWRAKRGRELLREALVA